MYSPISVRILGVTNLRFDEGGYQKKIDIIKFFQKNRRNNLWASNTFVANKVDAKSEERSFRFPTKTYPFRALLLSCELR